MMKKTVFVVLLAALVTAAYAQDAGQFTVGARVGPTFGFHSAVGDLKDMLDDAEDQGADVTKKLKINFGGAIYGNYSFTDALSLQAEANFMVNQGFKYEISGGGQSEDIEVIYKSIDIPILVKYSFLKAPVVVGILAGPYVSIPLGDITAEIMGQEDDTSPKGVGFGATAGVYAGYPLGPGRIVGDVRFMFDFMPLKADESGTELEILARRGLVLGIGYEISF